MNLDAPNLRAARKEACPSDPDTLFFNILLFKAPEPWAEVAFTHQARTGLCGYRTDVLPPSVQALAAGHRWPYLYTGFGADEPGKRVKIDLQRDTLLARGYFMRRLRDLLDTRIGLARYCSSRATEYWCCSRNPLNCCGPGRYCRFTVRIADVTDFKQGNELHELERITRIVVSCSRCTTGSVVRCAPILIPDT